ncbi:hypothetical protein H4R35_001699 [Dimargaris xerosporica]|nr:hypothetical protein H4R35_001699 [Dimargaris xerosporica]
MSSPPRPRPSKGILKPPPAPTSQSVWKRLQTKILSSPSSHSSPTSASPSDQASASFSSLNELLDPAGPESPDSLTAHHSPASPDRALFMAHRGLRKLGFRKSSSVSSMGFRKHHGSDPAATLSKPFPGHSSKRLSFQSVLPPHHRKIESTPIDAGRHGMSSRASIDTAAPSTTRAPRPHRIAIPEPTATGLPILSTDALRRLDLVDSQRSLDSTSLRRVRFSLPTTVTEYCTEDQIIYYSDDPDDHAAQQLDPPTRAPLPKEILPTDLPSTTESATDALPSGSQSCEPLQADTESSQATIQMVTSDPAAPGTGKLVPLSTDTVNGSHSSKSPHSPLSSLQDNHASQPPGRGKRQRRSIRRARQPLSRDKPQQAPQYPLELVYDSYRRSCLSLSEMPLPRIEGLFIRRITRAQPFTSLILTGEHISRQQVLPLAEMLDLNFGLRRLVLEDCGLDDAGAKVLMHSLIYSDQLEHVSLARNKRIRAEGASYLSMYLKESRRLKSLDLSGIPLDRKMVRYLCSVLIPRVWTPSRACPVPASAYSTSPASHGDHAVPKPNGTGARFLRHCSLATLRLDDCHLKASLLEQLCLAVHFSQVRHLSLRLNKINALGVEAWATPLLQPRPFIGALGSTARDSRLSSTPTDSNSPNPIARSYDYTSSGCRTSAAQCSGAWDRYLFHNLLTPLPDSGTPRSSLDFMGTWYPATTAAIAPSSPPSTKPSLLPSQSLISLDLSDNDIKAGVYTLGQLLQQYPNTLESLSLCNNRLDALVLCQFSQCLEHNRGLRSLDLGRNQLCHPSLDGLEVLARSLARNQDLKALFMEQAGLVDEAAIILAERLPEIRHLAHLNLSHNPHIQLAGLMALAASVKVNTSLVCLEVTIAPNDDIMSKLSQDILNVCVRNMERQASHQEPQQPRLGAENAARGSDVANATAAPALSIPRHLTTDVATSDPSPSSSTESVVVVGSNEVMPLSESMAASGTESVSQELPANQESSSPASSASIVLSPAISTVSLASTASEFVTTESDELAVQTVDIKDLLHSSFDQGSASTKSSSSAESFVGKIADPAATPTASTKAALSQRSTMVPAISTQQLQTPLGPLRKSRASPTVRQFHPIITANSIATPEPTLMATTTASSHLQEQNRALREEEGRVLRKAKEVMNVLIASPGLQSSDSSSESDHDLSDANRAQDGSISRLPTVDGHESASPLSDPVHAAVSTSPETLGSTSNANQPLHSLVVEEQVSIQRNTAQQTYLSKSISNDSSPKTLPLGIAMSAPTTDTNTTTSQAPSILTNEAYRTPTVQKLVNLSQRAHRSMSNPTPFTKRISSEPLSLQATDHTTMAPGGNANGGPLQYLTRRLSRATAGTSPKAPWPDSAISAMSASTEAMPRSTSVDGKHHRRPRRQRALSWQYLLAEDSMAFAGALLEDISGEELKTKLLEDESILDH